MIFKEDIIRDSINVQRDYVRQSETNFDNFCALDDKHNAWQSFWHLAQQRALLREMQDIAKQEGIEY